MSNDNQLIRATSMNSSSHIKTQKLTGENWVKGRETIQFYKSGMNDGINVNISVIIKSSHYNILINHISVVSRRPILLVEDTGANHRPATLSHNVISSTPWMRHTILYVIRDLHRGYGFIFPEPKGI